MLKLSILLLFITLSAQSEVLQTNAAYFHNPPSWMKRTKLEKAIDRVQTKLEWSTRRINVYYHNSEAAFNRSHELGAGPIAVAIKDPQKQVIHLGPKVTEKNYQEVIGHELVHIIIYQKYKEAIPRWLEEGLANHLSTSKKINYKWLSQQDLPSDVTKLSHPFKQNIVSVHTHYMSSQALAEMLDKKCKLQRLLQLSVQRKMQNYIKTYCQIPNINKAFHNWVQLKAKGA